MIELRWKKVDPLEHVDVVVVKICDPKLYGLYDYGILQYREAIQDDWKNVEVQEDD